MKVGSEEGGGSCGGEIGESREERGRDEGRVGGVCPSNPLGNSLLVFEGNISLI